MSRKRLTQIIVAAFIVSLPGIALVWSSEGGLAAMIFTASMIAMLASGLIVARRL